MAYLIEKIKLSLAKEGIQSRTNKSRDWIKAKLKELNPRQQSVTRDKIRLRDRSLIGEMYFFYYEPKLKDSLPYYDRFPLVLPIERYSDGILGLNLHYIHPKQRIILLDKLSEFLNNSKYDESTKFKINYSILKNASRIYESKPCLKRYLYSHIESRFIRISPDEWDIAALLPLELFEKHKTSKVWYDSRKKF
jgi:hypothetical protein